MNPQAQAALHRLEKVCTARPELRALGQINSQLLRTLFAENRPPKQPDNSSKWRDGIPIFHSDPPQLCGATIQKNWIAICQVLAANGTYVTDGTGGTYETYGTNGTHENHAVQEAPDVSRREVHSPNLQTPEPKIPEAPDPNSPPSVPLTNPADLLHAVISGSLNRLHLDTSLVLTVLRLSALPLLATVTQGLEPQLRNRFWDRGDCPLCGNWPLLAELRGLEQLRWLRCGWCSAQWLMDRLVCPYCQNRDHRKLRDIVVEGQEDAYRLSVCDACGESVPTLATLMPLSAPGLIVAEMETLHLRLVNVSGN